MSPHNNNLNDLNIRYVCAIYDSRTVMVMGKGPWRWPRVGQEENHVHDGKHH